MNKNKKLTISITSLVLICFCLVCTSFIFAYSILPVSDNYVRTGGIEIDLNSGNPLIGENEFLFEPGMTIEKDFYIENNGTWPVYYKLYFSNIEGKLGDVLDVTVLEENGNTLLYGKLSSLTKSNVSSIEDELAIGEKQDLTIRFYFPIEIENSVQSEYLNFDFSAIAVQTKNNPAKKFD